MPYAMQTSRACISLTARFITSTGHGAPAITPVRSEVRSNSPKRGCSSCAIHIVGTPYTLVHRSSAMASSVARGSKLGAGYTIVAPLVVHPRLPMPIPKQWYKRHRVCTRGLHSSSRGPTPSPRHCSRCCCA